MRSLDQRTAGVRGKGDAARSGGWYPRPVIYRNILHIDGPAGSGKTSLVEDILRSTEVDVACLRAIRDDKVPRPRESCPGVHPELDRYRSAGATGVALYSFARPDSEAFYESDFMTDYSEAVVIEGDLPLEGAESVVYVARPALTGPNLLRRVSRDHTKEREKTIAALELAAENPESMVRVLLGKFGDRAIATDPKILEKARNLLASQLAEMRSKPWPAPTEHWALCPEYHGIERAQVVVVNVHGEVERSHGERFIGEVKRLRGDEAVFRDILHPLGSKIPITAVAADLSDPRDPGLRRALTRIKRDLKSTD